MFTTRRHCFMLEIGKHAKCRQINFFLSFTFKYVLKQGYHLKAKNAPKNWNQSVQIFWVRLASFGRLGFISDPPIVSKFNNETHDPKRTRNTIHTIVKGRETIYHRHTVPVTSCSEVKYVLKKVILWKQRMHKRTETRVCTFFGPD